MGQVLEQVTSSPGFAVAPTGGTSTWDPGAAAPVDKGVSPDPCLVGPVDRVFLEQIWGRWGQLLGECGEHMPVSHVLRKPGMGGPGTWSGHAAAGRRAVLAQARCAVAPGAFAQDQEGWLVVASVTIGLLYDLPADPVCHLPLRPGGREGQAVQLASHGLILPRSHRPASPAQALAGRGDPARGRVSPFPASSGPSWLCLPPPRLRARAHKPQH